MRIDKLVCSRGLAESRQRAQALIMAGKVFVDGTRVDKAGTEVDTEAGVEITGSLPFVSRGGLKLEGALDNFNLDVRGLAVLDVGSSTGGFTDCLLQRGAARVVAVDVGKGLIDVKLRGDARVKLLEGRNIRYLEKEEVGADVDMAVIDVSFISLSKVLPRVKGFLKAGGRVLALVKPQFEVGPGEVGKGGIVRDPAKHQRAVGSVEEFSRTLGFKGLGVRESPITGAKGNREFWLLLAL